MTTLLDKILTIKNSSQARLLVDQIESGVYTIKDLMDIFFSDQWRVSQKASWPLTLLAYRQPELILPYINQMIAHLDNAKHDAIIRNTIRTWQLIDIPTEYEGVIYEKCFEYFADPSYAIAIRVFAMTVCSNIAMRHHSLAAEIIPIIEDSWDHTTAAWRSRGKKELKRLKELNY